MCVGGGGGGALTVTKRFRRFPLPVHTIAENDLDDLSEDAYNTAPHPLVTILEFKDFIHEE